jgi:hypothetical protein
MYLTETDLPTLNEMMIDQPLARVLIDSFDIAANNVMIRNAKFQIQDITMVFESYHFHISEMVEESI